jgi:hypothetical protein
MHASIFCVDCETIDIFDNDIKQISDAGVRFDNCRQGNIYRNNITDWLGATYAPKGGAYGIQIGNQPATYGHTALTTNINIYNNYIQSGACGVELEDYLQTAGATPQNVHVYNNLLTNCGWTNWAAYFSGISLYCWGNGVVIEYNTIDNAYRAGILITNAISSGTAANVRYNNIINTVQSGGDGGYGIWNKVPLDFSIVAEYNYLTNNISGNYLNVTPVSELAEYLATAIPIVSVDPAHTDFIRVVSSMGMYAAEPTMLTTPYTDEEDVEDGDQGLMFPTADGYTFQKFESPRVGQKALIYPAHSRGEYYLLRVAETVEDGQEVIAVPDKNGNYWTILTK